MINWQKGTIALFIIIPFLTGCAGTKKFKNTVPPKDSTFNNAESPVDANLRKEALTVLDTLKDGRINYTTFSAKIKIQYQDRNGAQPDGNAVLRLYKDSAIWVSISGSILNVEALRVLITPDSVTILYKLEKIAEKHPFQFIEETAHMPLNFSVLQDLIVGNPVYVGDSVTGYQITDEHILLATLGPLFKNRLTLSANARHLQASTLQSVNGKDDRLIHLFYGNYEAGPQGYFSSSREIMVEDESRLKMAMTFRQYEFNKELSVSMSIPSNYKTK